MGVSAGGHYNPDGGSGIDNGHVGDLEISNEKAKQDLKLLLDV